MKKTKILVALCLCALICSLLPAPALAAADVSSAIESTWQAAAGQIKAVVNDVVFPAIDLILAVLFFVKLATSYLDYRKHGNFEFAGPAILSFGLILALTAPLYLWNILGI